MWACVTSSSASPFVTLFTSEMTFACTSGFVAREYRLKRTVGVVVLSPSANSDRQIIVTSLRLELRRFH